MKEKYDHTQLKAGDPVIYGRDAGWGMAQWDITRTKVERLTATQIVMANGTRFRRDLGTKVGDRYGGRLLDPKGSEVRDAFGQLEASAFGYSVDQWDKQRRGVRTLEAWGVCLSQLEALIASARRQINEIEKGFE